MDRRPVRHRLPMMEAMTQQPRRLHWLDSSKQCGELLPLYHLKAPRWQHLIQLLIRMRLAKQAKQASLLPSLMLRPRALPPTQQMARRVSLQKTISNLARGRFLWLDRSQQPRAW